MEKIIVVQPYYGWQGHYKKYLDCLVGDILIKVCFPFKHMPRVFLIFAIARVLNSMFSLFRVFWFVTKGSPLVHFLEFEPVTLLTAAKLLPPHVNIIVTIHSVRRQTSTNKLKKLVFELQGRIFARALVELGLRSSIFVVHSESHRKELVQIFGVSTKYIHVIDYPTNGLLAPEPRSNIANQVVIFGLMREDKGIFEFLDSPSLKQVNLKAVGKILDPRLTSFFDKYQIPYIDKYVSEDEAARTLKDADFLLVPYCEGYSGGAGPLRDAASYGLPVICSRIPILEEVIEKHKFGIVVSSLMEVPAAVAVSTKEYHTLSSNALQYASRHNWNTFSDSYSAIYSNFQSGGRGI